MKIPVGERACKTASSHKRASSVPGQGQIPATKIISNVPPAVSTRQSFDGNRSLRQRRLPGSRLASSVFCNHVVEQSTTQDNADLYGGDVTQHGVHFPRPRWRQVFAPLNTRAILEWRVNLDDSRLQFPVFGLNEGSLGVISVITADISHCSKQAHEKIGKGMGVYVRVLL